MGECQFRSCQGSPGRHRPSHFAGRRAVIGSTWLRAVEGQRLRVLLTAVWMQRERWLQPQVGRGSAAAVSLSFGTAQEMNNAFPRSTWEEAEVAARSPTCSSASADTAPGWHRSQECDMCVAPGGGLRVQLAENAFYLGWLPDLIQLRTLTGGDSTASGELAWGGARRSASSWGTG